MRGHCGPHGHERTAGAAKRSTRGGRRVGERPRVTDGLQRETVWWCNPGGSRTITGCQDLTEPFHGLASLADLDEAADDRANLLMAERRSTESHMDGLVAAGNSDRVDAPSCRAAGGAAAEAGKVMLAQQGLGCLLHRPDSQRPSELPDPMAVARVDGPVGDDVVVGALDRAEPCVEIQGHLADAPDRDLATDQPVELSGQRRRVDCIRDVEVHHLRKGVDASIGAPRTGRRHLVPEQARQGGLELALDRAPVTLPGEPEEAATVVGQVDAKTNRPGRG